MAIVGTILQEVIKKKKNSLEKKHLNYALQQETLYHLLSKSKNTEFGQDHRFSEILNSGAFVSDFQKNVPVYDYEKIYKAIPELSGHHY